MWHDKGTIIGPRTCHCHVTLSAVHTDTIEDPEIIIVILFFYSANSRMADRCAVQDL